MNKLAFKLYISLEIEKELNETNFFLMGEIMIRTIPLLIKLCHQGRSKELSFFFFTDERKLGTVHEKVHGSFRNHFST